MGRPQFTEASTLMPAQSFTAAPTLPIIRSNGATWLNLYINVTNLGVAQTVTPVIKGFDPISGQTFTILTGAAINATGFTRLRVGPHIASGANIAQDFLPDQIQVSLTLNNGTNVSASISFDLGGS